VAQARGQGLPGPLQPAAQAAWKATEEERAIVCALRQATSFPLDDLTFVVSHFLPHLNRDAVYRILKAEGLGCLPPAQQRKRKIGTFKDYDLGFVHLDIKHLPKLQTADGERRKRYLYVAIDRCSRWVHLAVRERAGSTAVRWCKGSPVQYRNLWAKEPVSLRRSAREAP